MKKSAGKVTIYDVARDVGVSTATVNRAINNETSVRPETRERVMESVRRMGYRPSRTAASMSRAPIRIGVVVQKSISGFVTDVERGILKGIKDYEDFGFQGEVCEIPKEDGFPVQFLQQIDRFVQNKAQGILLLPGNETVIAEHIGRKGYAEKTVFATVVSDVPSRRSAFSVRNDGMAAGRMAAELLGMTLREKRKAVIVTGDSTSVVHTETIQGFVEASANFGVQYMGVYEHKDNPMKAIRLADRVVEEVPDLGGIYFSSANSITFCKRLIERGVIDRYKIITSDLFPDIGMMIRDGHVAATIYQNPFQQGRQAAKYLYEYLSGDRRVKAHNTLLRPQIVLRSNLDCYACEIEKTKYDLII